ncbi:MAG: FmdE family protein [Gammaproteobacteria bacterium]|nr:FmdE family protein [Gammaproteobacteria bacterium]
MNYPGFFDDVPNIILQDPLAEFLGATEHGMIEYSYLDAVKLAGHSCPTVAGAYLMTRKALASLYGDEPPVRGSIRVEFRDGQADGVTGVTANVVGLLTGAAQSGGFKGIAGKFDRRDLLHFNAEITGEIRYTRLDNGMNVTVSYHPESVPPLPAIKELMQKFVAGIASAEERIEFGLLWQERVKRILIDNADNPELVIVAGG